MLDTPRLASIAQQMMSCEMVDLNGRSAHVLRTSRQPGVLMPQDPSLDCRELIFFGPPIFHNHAPKPGVFLNRVLSPWLPPLEIPIFLPISNTWRFRARPGHSPLLQKEERFGMAPFVRAQLNYYSVLGIDPTAGTAEVNRAFRHLAWRYHPDRNPAPGATVQFQNINEAHQVLSDASRRASYDARWHPKLYPRCCTKPAPPHPHAHRKTHRRHRVRAVLLTLLAFVLLSSAWVAILTAVATRHNYVSSYASEGPWSFPGEAFQDSTFSMEMYPVSYADVQGRRTTAWETDIRSSWGGSARVSSVPDLQSQRAFGNLDRFSNR
jgi:curved DNA-binding protein CbpA